MSRSGGQTYVLPIPRNGRTTALMERDGQFLRQERPGLRVWRGGLILTLEPCINQKLM